MMKKLTALLLALMLVVFALPVMAEGTETMLGGWTAYDTPLEIPENTLATFQKATETLLGCTYEPIALLGTQVVAGMNYCLLCKCTTVTPDAPINYVLMYLYCGVDGTCEVLNIQNIEFDAFATTEAAE